MLPRQTRSHIYPWRHGTEGSSVTRGTHSGVALEDATTSLEINHFCLTDVRFVLYVRYNHSSKQNQKKYRSAILFLTVHNFAFFVSKGEKSWTQTRTSFRDGRETKTAKTCLRADDDDNDDDDDSPVSLFCFTETRHEQNWKLFSHPSPVDVHENGVYRYIFFPTTYVTMAYGVIPFADI
ncbi:hypothetical protein V1477_009421 [Vespula maculifrons]|uniref:Uncharacterized protein n=1 Tax=Vespula maculifrons TaxID=7453 RepID=A0ABD2C9P7_VESMC